MAETDTRTRFMRAANLAKTPERRAHWAQRYRELYGQDVPRMSGPVLEGELGLGPPTLPRPPKAEPVSAAEPEPPPEQPGFFSDPIGATGRELRSLGALVGIGSPDPGDTRHATRAKRLEYIGDQASSAATLGVSRALMDRMGVGLGDQRRAELAADPEVANLATTTAAGLLGTGAGMLGGPAAMADQAITEGFRRVARPLAERVPSQVVRAVTGPVATGTTSGLAQNAAQNVAENRPIGENAGLAAGLGGLLGPLFARLAGGGQRSLRGTPEDPTWIGHYRDAVESGRLQHKATSPDEPGFEGVPIARQPSDVKKVDPASTMAMRDQREAAELAAKRAASAHQRRAKGRKDALEARARPHLGARVGRDSIQDYARRQMAQNVDPNLGTVDASRARALQAIVDRLESTRPSPGAPVLQGARVPQDQPGLPLPGRAPLQGPTPPMTTPREVYQGRIPFGERPAPSGPYGLQPTPPMSVPREAYQARMPYAVDDVSAAPVGRGAQPEVDERWAPGSGGAQFRERLPSPVGQEVAGVDLSQMSLLDLASSAGRGPPPGAPRFAATGAAPPTSPPPRPPVQMEMSAPDPSRVPHPDMAPPREMFPADPRAGEQLAISAPAPGTIPGFEASGGVGSYQARLPIAEPEPRMLNVDEVLRNPTIGGLRQMRAQARQRANFENPAPTPGEMDARAEYDVWDQAIKEFAPEEFLGVEREMASSAKQARRAGDIMYRSEDSVVRGGDLPDPERPVRVEDLGDEASGTMRVGKEQAIRKFFQRVGDNNVPGQDVRSYHEWIGDYDPDLRQAQQFVRDRKAVEAVRPGLRAMLPLDLQGAADTVKLPLISQWARVAGGRVLDPLLGAISRHGGKSSRLVPLLRDPLDAILSAVRSGDEEEAPLENETDVRLRNLRRSAEEQARRNGKK